MRTTRLTYTGVIHSKKNSKQIVKDPAGRPRIISNARSREMERDMTEQFQTQLWLQGIRDFSKTQVERILEVKNKGESFEVEMQIWEPNKIRRDLDNQATSILDGLVKAGALPDDCATIVRKLTVEYAGIDRQSPRAEIVIKRKGGMTAKE